MLNATSMPAVLGEFGFMDSAVDTPIILTETYADRLAAGSWRRWLRYTA